MNGCMSHFAGCSLAIEIEAKRFKIGDPKAPSGKIPKSSGLHLLSGFDYDDEQEAYFPFL